MYLRLILLLPLLLSACGDLPEPFLGNPGATARRLAVPVTPMLAVPPPAEALMNDSARQDFADLLAMRLADREIAALARVPRKFDWRLTITAQSAGDKIVPRYTVFDSTGKEQGTIDGLPLPANAWTAGWPATLGQAAQDAVPRVEALLTTIRVRRDRADPNSLMNRVAKLHVPPVTGAPGDGDAMLTRQIRARLIELGTLVQMTPDGADFSVKGVVSVTAPAKGRQRVEIVWTVSRPSGSVTGKVSQLNSIEAGSLNHNWGEVAVAIGQEASRGINTVVENFINRDPPKPAAK